MAASRARRYLDPFADELLRKSASPRLALFLDRDGVVNADRGYVHTPEQTLWIPGIFELCRAAHENGYLPIVVTNQAGIARGYYTEAQFLDYTAWVHRQFAAHGSPLVATYYCPHHPTHGLGDYYGECGCRKPQPGMILSAAAELSIDLAGSLLLGDKESDIQAAVSANLGHPKLFFSGGPDGVLPSFEFLRA